MTFFKEFKKFITRSNVADLAIAVALGAAFGRLITSLVGDILLPPIGLLLRGADLKSFKWILQSAGNGDPLVAIGYGSFIQATIELLIITLLVFSVVSILNKLRPKEEKPLTQKQVSDEAKLLTEIRDLLKKKTP